MSMRLPMRGLSLLGSVLLVVQLAGIDGESTLHEGIVKIKKEAKVIKGEAEHALMKTLHASEHPVESSRGLSKADQGYISSLVANVTSLRKEMEASGMTEKLLRSRLEAALLAQKALESVPASREGDANPVCPPPGFDSLSPFSVKDYISASWYVQKQVPVIYQPPITLFCVKATYLPVDPKNLTAGLRVFNYANIGAANGPSIGGTNGVSNFFELRARVYNASAPSKLAVGPYFSGPLANLTLGLLGLTDVPSFFTGPYWVVAAGPKVFGDPDFKGYDWAIISGGPPTTVSNGACMTGNGLPFFLEAVGAGYWFFTREQVASKETLAEMDSVGKSLGFDNSVLLPVTQKGCTYEGSTNVL